MRCRGCNEIIRHDALKCHECGCSVQIETLEIKVSAPQESKQEAKQKKSKKRGK